MIGDTSNFPNSYDVLYNVYDENYIGYAISDEKRLIPEALTLKLYHPAKKDTIIIQDMIETTGTPIEGEFKVTDYAVPTAYEGQTGIDYEIGQNLSFHSSAKGNTIKVSYTTPGTKIDSTLLNLIIDAISNIQITIGQVGKDRNLDTGLYKNIASFVAYLSKKLFSHTHDGKETEQLTTAAFSTIGLKNTHIATDANIDQSKINKGIKEWGTSAIPLGDSKEIIITSSFWNNSNKRVVLSRGVIGQVDGGDLGELVLDGSYNETTGFKIKFLSSVSSLSGAIPFNYILY